jgi:hypothetical protein
MSHFYGTVQGNRGIGTRRGSSKSGLDTTCASWEGAVCCRAYVGEDGRDHVFVSLERWHGKGTSRVLYEGLISGEGAS